MKNRNEMMLRRARARHRATNRRVNEDWALQVTYPQDAQISEPTRQEAISIFQILIEELEGCFEGTADNSFAFIADMLRDVAQLTSSLLSRYTTDYTVVVDNSEDDEIEIDDEYTAHKKSRRRK